MNLPAWRMQMAAISAARPRARLPGGATCGLLIVACAALAGCATRDAAPAHAAASAAPAATVAPRAPASAVEPASIVIGSQAQLARYLRDTLPGQSPLDALSPGARKRFLSSLKFGRGGVGGFSTADLQEELTAPQIHALLALFGSEDYADSIMPSAHPLHGGRVESAIEMRFDAFFLASEPSPSASSRAHRAAMAEHYARQIAPLQNRAAFAGASDHDLTLLYRAAQMASVSAADPRYLHDLRADLTALAQRGQATPRRVQTLHSASIAARDFSAANRLAAAYPDARIKRLPPLHTAASLPANQPGVLLLRGDGSAMQHQTIAMDVPLRIVVIAGCHFSVDAVNAIESVPALGRLFHRHAVWLADQNESLTDVQTWNVAHPDQPMKVAWRNSQWRRIDRWAIPTFYIFRNGQRVDRWSGWPSGGDGMRVLRHHLLRDGLLPAAATATPRTAQPDARAKSAATGSSVGH